MACPICTTPESSAIAEGIRAGALVLIVVSAVVMSAFARFAWRLWSLQPFDSADLAQGKESK
jgi:hypothetical protein